MKTYETLKHSVQTKDMPGNVFVSDTETSSILNYDEEGRVRIILWSIVNLSGDIEYRGYDSKSIVDCLEDLAKANKKNKPVVYFHNAKFDFSFIIPELLKRGYAGDDEPREFKNKDGNYIRTHKPYSVSVLRSALGSFYQAQIFLNKGLKVTIKDSMKFYPGPLSTYGDIFGVKKLYGDFDYEKYRPINYKFNKEELLYFNHDIEILRRMIVRKIKDGKNELTRAGYAYNDVVELTLKDMYNKKSNMYKVAKYMDCLQYENDKKTIENEDYSIVHSSGKTAKARKELFQKFFPSTSLSERLEWVDAYSGGFVWSDEEHPFIYKGVVYDCNSEYPAAMMNGVLPFGNYETFSGDYYEFLNKKAKIEKETEFTAVCIINFKADFKLKNDTEELKYFPVLPKKYSAYNTYITSSDQLKSRFDGSITLTNFDFVEFLKNYDVSNIKFIKGWLWKATTGVFKNFVKHHADAKIEQTHQRDAEIKWLKDNQTAPKEDIQQHQRLLAEAKLQRQEAKLTMNSGYGQFAESPSHPSSLASLEDGVVRYRLIAHNKVDTRNTIEAENSVNGKYFPAGIFITAAARQILFKAMYAANKRVRYIDTDSVHLEGDEEVEGMDCDQAILGKWKVESRFSRGHYLRAKTYEEFQTFPTNKEGKPFNKVTLAGFDETARNYYFKDFGNLKYGIYGVERKKGERVTIENGTQGSKTVIGGTIITRNPKKITELSSNGESQRELMNELHYQYFQAKFWTIYHHALKLGVGSGGMYFRTEYEKLIEYVGKNNIKTKVDKDPARVYRDFVLQNLDLCLKNESFIDYAEENML